LIPLTERHVTAQARPQPDHERHADRHNAADPTITGESTTTITSASRIRSLRTPPATGAQPFACYPGSEGIWFLPSK
jgi:hypothetical protein